MATKLLKDIPLGTIFRGHVANNIYPYGTFVRTESGVHMLGGRGLTKCVQEYSGYGCWSGENCPFDLYIPIGNVDPKGLFCK